MGDRFLLLVLTVTLAELGHGFSIQKETRSPDDLGILNPQRTYISNFSYTVAVLVGIDVSGGGALIEQNWVLTAASAVRGFNASRLTVRVGSNSAYQGGRTHILTKVIVHPKYPTNSSYNLALLKIDTPIYPKVATKVTYVASIPFMDNGVNGNVTGYGATSSSSQNNESPGVQIAFGSVYTANYCQQHWGRSVSSLNICHYSSNVVPCYGDDGDPLTRCWADSQCELLGIYTGIDKCDTYEPYAMMDVGQFSDWIQETIKENS